MKVIVTPFSLAEKLFATLVLAGLALVLLSAVVSFVVLFAGCTEQNVQRARTVLDGAELACDLLPQEDGTMAQICRRVDQAAPIADKCLEGVGAMLSDAGTDGPAP